MYVFCFVSASCIVSLCHFGILVNISVYILSEISIRLSNLFYTSNFIFVDVENAMRSGLVTCNNFINYKVLPALGFDFIGLDFSYLLQNGITSERRCKNDYCFSLALFIFPSCLQVFLRNKYKRVKAFFVCLIFLFSITKPNLLTKNEILKSTCETFTYESRYMKFVTHLIFIILWHFCAIKI